MSDHLDQPSQPSYLARLHRLRFRLVDVPDADEEEQIQATIKMPILSRDQAKWHKSFLLDPKLVLSPQKEQAQCEEYPLPLWPQPSQQEYSNGVQHSSKAGVDTGKNGLPPDFFATFTYDIPVPDTSNGNSNGSHDLVPKNGIGERRELSNTLTPIPPDNVQAVEQVETQHLAAVPHQNIFMPIVPGKLPSQKRITVDFDHVPASPAQSNGSTLDDDPDFEKLSTLPMLVLKGVSTPPGKHLGTMKSEVSGAAGAAGLVGIGNILGSVLKYAANFIIQYSLGPGFYGLYTLCLSIINLVSAVFSLGLDNAMIRYVAIYRGKKRTGSLRGLLLFCTIVVGIVGIAGALLVLFATPSLVAFWNHLRPGRSINNNNTLKQMTPLLKMMAAMIPLMGMQVVWFGGLRGFKAFKWSVLASNIIQPISLIVFLLAVFHFSHGVTGVAVVMVVSTALGTVLNLYFLFREYSRVATPGSEQYELREWITFSTLTFLSNLVVTLLDSIDTILLASFGLSKVAIGQYGAAIRLSPFITIPLQSLNVIFSPTIAELHSKGEQKKLEDMFKIVTKWAITFSLPIFLVASLFSPYILGLSGAGYMPAWPLLIAFCFGNLLGAATGSSGSMLLMTGHNKLSFLNSVVAIVVNVGLGIWLTPLYGAMGTAVSTGLAVGVLNIMRILQVRIVLKMQPYRLDTLKPLAAGLISSALTGALLYLFYSYGQSHRVYVLIGHAIISFQLVLMPIFLAIYVGLLMLFKLSPEDEIVLSALRKKFLRGQKRKKKLQEA